MRPDMRSPAVLVFVLAAGVALGAQAAPEKPAPVEKLGPNSYRIGQMRIDTAKREVVVPGTVTVTSPWANSASNSPATPCISS